MSRGSSGKSANWKMILYRPSNFHKFAKKLDLDRFLQVAFHCFMKFMFAISNHLVLVLKGFYGSTLGVYIRELEGTP